MPSSKSLLAPNTRVALCVLLFSATVLAAPVNTPRERRVIFDNMEKRAVHNMQGDPYEPFKAATALVYDANNDNYIDHNDILLCSATAVGPHQVATAAHCLYSREWEMDMTNATVVGYNLWVCVGYDAGSFKTGFDYCQDANMTRYYYNPQWANMSLSSEEARPYDYAVIEVEQDLTAVYMQLQFFHSSTVPLQNNMILSTASYGADHFHQGEGINQYEQATFAWHIDADDEVRFHGSTVHGDSGGGVFARHDHWINAAKTDGYWEYYFIGAISGGICNVTSGILGINQRCDNPSDDPDFADENYNSVNVWNEPRLCDLCDNIILPPDQTLFGCFLPELDCGAVW